LSHRTRLLHCPVPPFNGLPTQGVRRDELPTLDLKGRGGMKRENIRSKGLGTIGVIKGLSAIRGQAINGNLPSNRNPSVLREPCFGQGHLRSGSTTPEDSRWEYREGFYPPRSSLRMPHCLFGSLSDRVCPVLDSLYDNPKVLVDCRFPKGQVSLFLLRFPSPQVFSTDCNA